MPPLPPMTNQQRQKLAANLAKGRAERLKQTVNNPVRLSKPKYIQFSPVTKSTSQSKQTNVNFNKYAKELIAEKGWLANGYKNNKTSYKLPSIASADFKNKVSKVVQMKYNRNHPTTKVKLNQDSLFIKKALSSIEGKLKQLKQNSNTKPKSNTPPKPPARVVDGRVLPKPAKLTKQIIKQRKEAIKAKNRCMPVKVVAKASSSSGSTRPAGRPPAPCDTFPPTSRRCFERRTHPYPPYRCVCEGPSPKKRAPKSKSA